MTEQPAASTPRPDAELDQYTQPGSQSSSGMSTLLNDALIDAHEREKQRMGTSPDVAPDALPTVPRA